MHGNAGVAALSAVPTGIAVRQLAQDEIEAIGAGLSEGPAIAALRDEVRSVFTQGERAVLLRGFDLPICGEDGFARAMQVIGSWLGKASLQSPEGEVVARVEARPGDPQRRGTHSEDELQPHTDLHDILALGCVRRAASGGESFLLSGKTLHDRIVRDHPDCIPVLEEGYFFGTNPALRSHCPVSAEKVPVFFASPNETLVCWNGFFLRAATVGRGEPLPFDLEAALVVLRHAAAEMAAAATFTLVPGDMLFWHNWTWLHGRTAFADDPAAPRLLLRLWLRSELVPRPAVLAQRAERIDADHILTRALGYRPT